MPAVDRRSSEYLSGGSRRGAAALLRRELERHGFEGVEIAFDAPATTGRPSSPPRRSTSSSTTCARTSPRPRPRPRDMPRQRRHIDAPRRRCASRSPTRSPRGRRPSRTSTGCSRRCSRSSSPTRRCRPTCSPGRLAGRQPTAAIETEVGRPEGGEGRLLDLDRRPLQGLDRLRREARGRVRARRFTRGPEVRTQTMRSSSPTPRARTMEELQRFGGVSATRTATRWPTPGWRCPTLGRWTSTDARAVSSSTACAPATPRHRADRRGPRRRRHGDRAGRRRRARARRRPQASAPQKRDADGHAVCPNGCPSSPFRAAVREAFGAWTRRCGAARPAGESRPDHGHRHGTPPRGGRRRGDRPGAATRADRRRGGPAAAGCGGARPRQRRIARARRCACSAVSPETKVILCDAGRGRRWRSRSGRRRRARVAVDRPRVSHGVDARVVRHEVEE